MFIAGTSSNLSGVVEIDEFAVSRCHIFVSFRNNVGINCTLRQHTVLDSNKVDLECPIPLKVRMSHGSLVN